MTLVVDAAPLIALADRADPRREAVQALFYQEDGELIVPAQVTAEVDYLLGSRHGSVARRAFLDDLSSGRFVVPCLQQEDYAVVVDLERSYHDLDLGLADCSIVVLAHRYRTTRGDVRPAPLRRREALQGGIFQLLPAPPW